MIHPITNARAWWEQAGPDLQRYTRTVLIAASIGLVAYLLVLWDFGLHPLRTALGGSDFSGFYDLQTRQLLHGRLNVPAGDLGLEAFSLRGKEYMYFPPGPSLLRAPFFLFTDALDSKFTAISMLASWVVSAVLLALLMWRVRLLVRGGAHLSRGEAAGFGVLLFTLLSGSVVLFLGSMPFVYHEAYAWAIAMALGATFCLVGLIQRPTTRGAVAAGAFTLGAILSRTTAGWACALGLLMAAVWFLAGRSDQPLPRRWVPTLVAAGLVPLGIGVALNWAKFRHPYIFPLEDQVWTGMSAQRRAALEANGGDLVSPSILPATIVNYFRPDGIRFTSLFPFITLPAEVPQNYGGSFLDQVYRTGSVVAFMPALLLLTIWGAVSAFRPGVTRAVRGLRIPLLSVAAIPGAIMLYGYIAMRYTSEFIPLFALGGTVGYIDLARRATERPRRWRPAFAVLGLLALFGFAANMAVAVSMERTANPGRPLTHYVRLQKALSDRTPGRPLDDLIHQATTLPATGPTDRIQIVDDCRAVFIGSGDPTAPWIPLAVQDREWDVRLDDPPTEPVSFTLAEADGVAGAGVQLEFDGDGRYRGRFDSPTEHEVGRWRPVPDGTIHVRLFPHLTEHINILLDVDRPKVGLVDVPQGELEPAPYFRPYVFRSPSVNGPPPAGISVTEHTTPQPPICVDLRERMDRAAQQ